MNVLMILLGAILFLDCIFLVLLVLLQLPKKDAGAGMAFGGAATDALFGAGSGNALTTLTKYCAGIFFGVSLFMAYLSAHVNKPNTDTLSDSLTHGGGSSSMIGTMENSNAPVNNVTLPASTNAPAAGSNAPAPVSKPAAEAPTTPAPTSATTNK